MKTKICTKCKKYKQIKDFYKDKSKKDGYHTVCKLCTSKHMITYRKNNKSSIRECKKDYYEKNRLKIINKYRKYYKLNKDKMLKQAKKYYRENRNKIIEKVYQYQLIHKDKIRKTKLNYILRRKCFDIKFRILLNLRSRLHHAIKRHSKNKTTKELVGCSIEQLKSHLEKKFTKGMSFANYGKWHIDHIRPCSKFNLSKLSQQKKCFNWKNLQPLWAKDNRSKGDKYGK